MGDNSSGAVEHGREDASVDAACRQQIPLVFSYLLPHLRQVPRQQLVAEVVFVGPYLPATGQPAGSVGYGIGSRHRQQQDVAIARSKSAPRLAAVAAHLDAQAYAQLVGKALCQQILFAKMSAVIVVAGIGTCDSKYYQLAAALYLVQVEGGIAGRHGVGYFAPWCYDGVLSFLAARGEGEQYNYKWYKYAFGH